jgi:hypothetical protein
MDALSAVGNLVVGGKARGTRDRPAHILPLGMREALTVRAELVRELRPYLDRNTLRQQAQPADQAQGAPAAKKSTTPRADASDSQSLSKKAKRRQRCLSQKYDSRPTAASLAQQWNVTFRTAEDCDHQVAVLVQLASMAQSEVSFAVVTRDTSDGFSCTCMDTSFPADHDPAKACIHVHIFRSADCHRSSRPTATAEAGLEPGANAADKETGMDDEDTGAEDVYEDKEHDVNTLTTPEPNSSTNNFTSLPRFVCKRVQTDVSLRVQHHDSLLSVFDGTGRCIVLRLTRTKTIKCETCKGSTCSHAVFWQQS